MRTHTKKSQSEITPQEALDYLKEGNQRFINNLRANRNLLNQVNETSDGQFPFAIVLSCIDSRTSVELIFDQGLGDVFSARVAGNVVNEDILGSMEYAVKYAGSKLIVVLGHSKCGAITSACNHVRDGNITALLHKIKPAIDKERSTKENRSGSNETFVNNVTELNVHYAMEEIKERSDIIINYINEGKVKLVGGVYNVDSGEVTFFED
ncbi:carbonic anhydrase [Belliella baltica DSM 15883]|uniref:Carbonic anhydrase n=1 Tax=Belliella baltica (strain DSM 15883 / CIP 108006 / LMG 21964 / BA134) TaxID=866536 RepID=I3Z5F4_BELBD|nr:carbonic anhydrase [Belliella baltica]AFL84472.1 carbonic anhydrase [Belliella baltica DSM 15883]